MPPSCWRQPPWMRIVETLPALAGASRSLNLESPKTSCLPCGRHPAASAAHRKGLEFVISEFSNGSQDNHGGADYRCDGEKLAVNNHDTWLPRIQPPAGTRSPGLSCRAIYQFWRDRDCLQDACKGPFGNGAILTFCNRDIFAIPRRRLRSKPLSRGTRFCELAESMDLFFTG